jgi:hypothetical protein
MSYTIRAVLGCYIYVVHGSFLPHNNPTIQRYLYSSKCIVNVRVVTMNMSSISPFTRMLRLNAFRNDTACLFLVIVNDECTDSRRDVLRVNIYTCQGKCVRTHLPFLIGRLIRKNRFWDSRYEGWVGLCLAPILGLRTRARAVARIPVYVSMWQRTPGMI